MWSLSKEKHERPDEYRVGADALMLAYMLHLSVYFAYICKMFCFFCSNVRGSATLARSSVVSRTNLHEFLLLLYSVDIIHKTTSRGIQYALTYWTGDIGSRQTNSAA